MSTAEKDPLDDLSSRLDAIEADLTTLKEHGCFDPSHDPDDRLDQLDFELSFVSAIQYPPPPHYTPAVQPEWAAHAAAWVPGGGE